jgi:hypothetical protein
MLYEEGVTVTIGVGFPGRTIRIPFAVDLSPFASVTVNEMVSVDAANSAVQGEPGQNAAPFLLQT